MKTSSRIQLISVVGNSQRLDGGAMFGNVPKAVWQKWYKTDEVNRIQLATRALLIKSEKHNILLEAGVGAFFPPELKKRYGIIEENHVLEENLNRIGLSCNDIDYVILSHLHFDHAGGLFTTWHENKEPELIFSKAKYIVSKENWHRSNNPHDRDKASFIPLLNQKLKDSGRLILIDESGYHELGELFDFFLSHGHTPGLLHAIYKDSASDNKIIFASDLIPAKEWVHLPVTMGYDRNAELVIDEKKTMLELAIEKDAYVFFTHDPNISMAKITKLDNKKYSIYDAIDDSVY